MGHTELYIETFVAPLAAVKMKVLLLTLFVALAVADDCIEPRPEYCAKNVHLCKVPGFIDFMKKMCPRHCGYCDTAASNDGCVEPRPEYCAKNAFLCHEPAFESYMKAMCPRTCGYCLRAAAGDCIEPRPEYCAKNVHLCKVPGFIDFMKKM